MEGRLLTMTRRSIIAACLLSVTLLAEPARITGNAAASLQKAIIAGDLARMKQALDEGADANAVDGEGTPALMNAALYGTAAHMKMLVDRGADVNARNPMDATALHWAAGDSAKARLLIEHGAEVNAVSKLGRTPLMAAASVAGNASTVRLMLSKGARVDLKDNIEPIPIIPAGGGKGTALMEASRTGDLETVRMLVEAGAKVNETGARNATALSEAVMYSRRDIVEFLLSKGASPAGAVSALQSPYLTLAAMRGDVTVARLLHRHGARVNATDAAGNTPLMWASASDHNSRAMVDFLMNAGADPSLKNKAGETAQDWAARKMPKDIAPAQPMGDVAAAEAVTKALAALGKSATYKKNACATCHNHTLPMVAAARAAEKGVWMDGTEVTSMRRMTVAMFKPMTPLLLEGSDVPPDLGITGGYIAEALQSQGYEPDRMTAALVHKVAQSQMADGRWVGWAPRPPMESGDIQATAMSVRALRLYPIPGRKAELLERISKARTWLYHAKPATTEEYIMRLEGLRESGAPASYLATAARQLAALQRPDGGWAQIPERNSDAYATGKAMVALSRIRYMSGANYKAAERFLRSTQNADGSWHVATRSYPFQPLMDTGFPHGRDQWISAAGTSWAAMALTMRLDK
jgi:ankyrin repeat protein